MSVRPSVRPTKTSPVFIRFLKSRWFSTSLPVLNSFLLQTDVALKGNLIYLIGRLASTKAKKPFSFFQIYSNTSSKSGK